MQSVWRVAVQPGVSHRTLPTNAAAGVLALLLAWFLALKVLSSAKHRLKQGGGSARL